MIFDDHPMIEMALRNSEKAVIEWQNLNP